MAPLIPFIPLIAAGIGAATTGYALANQPKAPEAPAPIVTQTKQGMAQDTAAMAQANALTKRRGLASTILTSPMGTPSGNTQSSTLGIG